MIVNYIPICRCSAAWKLFVLNDLDLEAGEEAMQILVTTGPRRQKMIGILDYEGIVRLQRTRVNNGIRKVIQLVLE
jgi:hypothetical protein